MLRQIFCIAAFLLILSGILSSVVAVERSSLRHIVNAEKIIESANETN